MILEIKGKDLYYKYGLNILALEHVMKLILS